MMFHWSIGLAIVAVVLAVGLWAHLDFSLIQARAKVRELEKQNARIRKTLQDKEDDARVQEKNAAFRMIIEAVQSLSDENCRGSTRTVDHPRQRYGHSCHFSWRDRLQRACDHSGKVAGEVDR